VLCVVEIHAVVSVLYDSLHGTDFSVFWEHAVIDYRHNCTRFFPLNGNQSQPSLAIYAHEEPEDSVRCRHGSEV